MYGKVLSLVVIFAAVVMAFPKPEPHPQPHANPQPLGYGYGGYSSYSLNSLNYPFSGYPSDYYNYNYLYGAGGAYPRSYYSSYYSNPSYYSPSYYGY